MIIDTHVHIYSPNENAYQPIAEPMRPPPDTGTVEQLQSETRGAGVDRLTCPSKPGPAGMLVSWNVKEMRAVHEEIPVHAVAERPPMTVRRKFPANSMTCPQGLYHQLC